MVWPPPATRASSEGLAVPPPTATAAAASTATATRHPSSRHATPLHAPLSAPPPSTSPPPSPLSNSSAGSMASGVARHAGHGTRQLVLRPGHGSSSAAANSSSSSAEAALDSGLMPPLTLSVAALPAGGTATATAPPTPTSSSPPPAPANSARRLAELQRHAHAAVRQVKALLPRPGAEGSVSASWLRAVLFFLMYALQGVPVALIDFHVRRAWRDAGMPPAVDRLWYVIMYWPYMVRCVVAFVVDGVLPREPRAKRTSLFRLLHSLTAALCAALAAASLCPITPADATPASMWALLLIMAGTSVIAACSDVLLDSLGFEAASLDGDDASRNAMQIIAFKCGKFGVQLAVAWMLVELELSWFVSLRWCFAAAVAVLCLSLGLHRRLFAVAPVSAAATAVGSELADNDGSSTGDGDDGARDGDADHSPDSDASSGDEGEPKHRGSGGGGLRATLRASLRKFMRTGGAAVRYLRATRSGRALLALAVLHKFGEMVFRDQMGNMQDAHFRAEIAAGVPAATELAVASTQKAVSLGISNVIGFLDIVVTVLPSLATSVAAGLAEQCGSTSTPSAPPRRSNRNLTLLFATMACVSLARSLSLMRLAELASDEGAPMLVPPPLPPPPALQPLTTVERDAETAAHLAAWRATHLTPTWTAPLLVSAATTGLATSLFYIAAMSGVTMIVAEAPGSAPLRISMYSILEVADDVARALGAATAGALVSATGAHAPAFVVGSLFTLAPVAIAILLWRHAATLPLPPAFPAIVSAG